jgi:hypothetical protein
VKSQQNPKFVSQALFNEFQIPQICLKSIQTSWTKRGKLRLILNNRKSADWMRKIISQQLRTKLLQRGYVSSMFQKCFIIKKFNTESQYARRPGLNKKEDGQNYRTISTSLPDQKSNLQGQPPQILKNSGQIMLTELY